MKQMKLYVVVILLAMIIIPSVALASWWNPFSWNIWQSVWNSIFYKQVSVECTIAKDCQDIYKNCYYSCSSNKCAQIQTLVALKPYPDCSSVVSCVPNWKCGWGECKNGYQGQTAVDSNNCGFPSSTAKIACPALARECSQASCNIDRDCKEVVCVTGGMAHEICVKGECVFAAGVAERCSGTAQPSIPAPLKPVIYLYPQKVQQTKVQLDYAGKFIADYPAYDYNISGWNVTAYPDGKIINSVDGKEYSYLFWEGNNYNAVNYDLSKGFVVSGSEVREFLQSTLSKMGLTPKEYNEFIVYWYPKMKDNAYNLIHFANKEYTDTAKLIITPTPDSMLRVFMVFKPLDKEISVIPQDIRPFERQGFAVIEWGGSELNK